MSDFVQNAWYLAAWVSEVPDDAYLSRTLLGRAWLLFRKPEGGWALVEDRCPHRFVPLSRGSYSNGVVTCGYHGLAFNGLGQCVGSPFGEVPNGAKVASWPVVESHGGLWVWPGNPDSADESLIPDFGFIDAGEPMARAQYVMGVNYQLIADNLLDLSHIEFLHVQSFGTTGSIFSHGKQTVKQDENGAVWNNWSMTGAPPPGWAKGMLEEGATIDQDLHIRWNAPASLALFIEVRRAGNLEPMVPTMVSPHILTPETKNSTHYFFTHKPGPEGEAMARKVFLEEDEPMIAAQAEAMGDKDFWAMRPLVLASDKAAILVRRKLIQMMNAESGASEDVVSPALVTAG